MTLSLLNTCEPSELRKTRVLFRISALVEYLEFLRSNVTVNTTIGPGLCCLTHPKVGRHRNTNVDNKLPMLSTLQRPDDFL